MADKKDDGRRNPAEIRGDIDKGRTGDKVEGFDPAASPLETDSEAGGQPLSPEQVEMANARAERGASRAPGEQQASHNTAMRDFEGKRSIAEGRVWIWVLALAVFLILVVWVIA